MYLSVIIDAAALAVLILFARKGWRRGVVRTLSELIVVVLAMILAGKIADAAARQAVEYMRPAAHAAVAARSIMALSKGSTNEDLKDLQYTKVPRPIFPLDSDFAYAPVENLMHKSSR